MLPRLAVGQRDVDIFEYNSRYESKQKHICCNSNNICAYFCNKFMTPGKDEIFNSSTSGAKKCNTCKCSSFSVFITIIVVTVVLLLTHGTSNSKTLIAQVDQYSFDHGIKMSLKDAEIVRFFKNIKSEVMKV